MTSEIDLRGWPPLLVQIAELTSPETALKLVLRFGGVGCYFPHRPGRGQPLVEAIGLEAAQALAPAFGGNTIEIPVLAVQRHLKRAILTADGRTSEVARRLHCSARYVRMVRNSGGPDVRQLALFDET